MRAAVYLRISESDVDDGEATGIERQRVDCRALADKLGADVTQEFVDSDISAYDGKLRPAYTNLLAAVGARDVDVVIAYHLDRLHRSPLELETFIQHAAAHGVTHIHTCSGSLHLESTDDLFALRIMGAVARKASDDSSRRIKRKMRELAEQGKPHGGPRPFGYTADMQLEPAESVFVEEAATRVLSGEAANAIVRDWRARGVLTTRGNLFTYRAFVVMLTAARNAGMSEVHVSDPKRRSIVGAAQWPAIFTLDQLAAIRFALDPSFRSNFTGRRIQTHGNNTRALLLGMIACGRCGRQMRATTQNRYLRYVCMPGAGGCSNGISQARTDEHVELAVAHAVELGTFESLMHDATTSQQRAGVAKTVAALEAVEADLTGLAAAWGAGEISRVEWEAARRPLQERAHSLRSELEASVTVPALPVTDPSVWRSQWATWPLDRRRAALAVLLVQVTIRTSSRPGKFDASRVDLIWRG
jgi:site-specific DNA recombinase